MPATAPFDAIIGRMRVLCADPRGTTAVEFAIVGPIMILVIFMIIENGLMFFAQSVLDNATRMVSRQIQIGAVTTTTTFQSALCSNVSPLLDCSALHFDVTAGTAFPSGAEIPSSSGTFAISTVATGTGGQFVLVEVAYDRAYITPWLARIGGSSWVLLSTQAFQNEPFS